MPEGEVKVDLEEGVVFARTEGRELKCDVFRPPGASRAAPAIVLVHGGAWKLGNRSQLRGYGFLLGRAGFVCIAIEYRLSAEARWPAQIDDVKAALAWARREHQSLGIDPDRIAVLGHSSGAQMALVAAADELEAGVSHPVNAIVSFYAPTRLRAGDEMLKEPVREFLGPDAADDLYRQASPADRVRPGFPPTLILHSNADTIVPRTQATLLYDALVAAGTATDLHIFDRVPHAFDADRALSRLCVSLIGNFIDRHGKAVSGRAAS